MTRSPQHLIPSPQVVHSRAEFLAARAILDGAVGVVMTMGALHAGHRALIEAAVARCDRVVVTIFVNPLQFAAGEDLDRYPRTAEADIALCAEAGADVIWMPGVDDVYAAGPVQVTVAPGPLGALLEGASRPGHFDGVLTVVCKFLQLVRPDAAFFGEKDYQQLTLIRRMVADLDIATRIVGVPTIRESDGLAMSSRNRYLDPQQRAAAAAIPTATAAAQAAGSDGAQHAIDAATAVLDAAPGLVIDYVDLRSPELGEANAPGEARLLVAVRLGATRLIDSVAIVLGNGVAG